MARAGSAEDHAMKTINAQEFEAEVLRASGTVLVDFYTDGCGPCRNLEPVLEEIGRDLAGRPKIVKVDAGAEGELAARFRVQQVPSLFLFKGGEAVAQRVGGANKAALLGWLDGQTG
jgi:thioredoxin 1